MLGLAQTGTGKTAAFALPILERLLAERKPGPRVLIVAPTRELAARSATRSALWPGSHESRSPPSSAASRSTVSARRCARRPEIVVACPGRLLDLMQQGIVRLDRVETLVLDEADHMFDMGFLPDVRRILAALPEERQNLLFSATMPREIRGLADGMLRNPHVVDAGPQHATVRRSSTRSTRSTTPASWPCCSASSPRTSSPRPSSSRAPSTAPEASPGQLEGAGHRAVALQGNMSQGQRERAMNGFRKRRFDVLVATDIAARGIDVEQVSHVVNFDMPNTTDAYTHRIGRTGRSEREGKAYTFVTDEDRYLVSQVEKRLGASIPRREVQGIESIPFPLGRSGNGGPQPRSSQTRARSAAGVARNRNRRRPRRP